MVSSEIYSATSQSSTDPFAHSLELSTEYPLLGLIPSSCQVAQQRYSAEDKQNVGYFEATILKIFDALPQRCLTSVPLSPTAYLHIFTLAYPPPSEHWNPTDDLSTRVVHQECEIQHNVLMYI
jgi:hypothetical protein